MKSTEFAETGSIYQKFHIGLLLFQQLTDLQEADMGSKGTGKHEEMEQFAQLRGLLDEIHAENSCLTLKDLAVDGKP